MAKLVAEIRGTFTSYSDITTENIAKLQYLPGVVDESLRVYPSTVQNFPRVVRKGGAVICGRFVPEKVSLTLCAYQNISFAVCYFPSSGKWKASWLINRGDD